jgi:hypothetical protein
MPADQGRRLDDQQGGPPLEESGPEDKSDTSGIREPTRSDLTLLIKRQLLAKEQIFSGQRGSGGKTSLSETGFHHQ